MAEWLANDHSACTFLSAIVSFIYFWHCYVFTGSIILVKRRRLNLVFRMEY